VIVVELGRVFAVVRDAGMLLAVVARCEGGDCHGYCSEVQVLREDALVQDMVATLLLDADEMRAGGDGSRLLYSGLRCRFRRLFALAHGCVEV